MPLFHHKNRSKPVLNELTPPEATPTESSSLSSSSPLFASAAGIADEAKTIPPQQHQQPYQGPQGPRAELDRASYQRAGDFPARSQSTRSPALGGSYPQQQPLTGGSADDLVLESRRLHQHQQQQQQQQQQQHYQQQQAQKFPIAPPAVEQKKSKSIFDRMRSSNHREPPAQTQNSQGSYNNTAGLARRLSRRQEVPPVIRTVQQRDSLDLQLRAENWQASPDSRLILPSPQEGVEEGLDPYLIQQGGEFQEQDQQSIRLVSNDSDQAGLEAHQQFQSQGHQHQLSLSQKQQFEAPQQDHYQHSPSQQLNAHPDHLGIIHDPYRQPNAETVSQLSYESPIEQKEEPQQRPVSGQSNGHSPIGPHTTQRLEHPNRTTSIPLGPRPASLYAGGMAPPAGASQQTRRSGDPKQILQGNQGPPDSRDGPPPGYRQQFSQGSTPTTGPGQSPIPPVVGNNQGPNYRGGPPQREQYGPTGGGEQGRNTPPPQPGERDVNDAYKELLQKYKKVKGLYFDKTAQVEQLQNTLANQRLSQSRTSLDDSEYMTRFQRLDGAIMNLSFNIRKDWRITPSWLAPYVNQDALKVGKQEMTAVGRACITRFLVDEIFNRTFHPSLEGELSLNLKNIEQNIRRFSPLLNNQEESDALTAKVVQWRLATLEGLKDVLNSPESEGYKEQFSRVATTNLTANLINFLQEPIPAGIEDSAHMIVELAVSIAANLPLESRDISIIYPMPGDLYQPLFMKLETGVPPLENPGVDATSEVDASSTASGDKDEGGKESEKPDSKSRKENKKSTGMLQAMMGGGSQGAGPKKQGSVSSQIPTESSSDGKGKISSEDGPQKVRFAGFVGVEVRGRQMLGKAPVWAVS